MSLFVEGPGGGYTIEWTNDVWYGTGGSHGGEAGAESIDFDAPSAYGNFISPDRFGSAGGNGGTKIKTHQGMLYAPWNNGWHTVQLSFLFVKSKCKFQEFIHKRKHILNKKHFSKKKI